MDAEFQCKHKQVREWLGDLFSPEDIPAYEANRTSVNYLYDLMTRNKMVDSDTKLITEDMRQKTEEYNAEAERLENILDNVGINHHQLSEQPSEALHNLSNVAQLLDLKRTTDSSYLLAIQRLDADADRISNQLTIVCEQKGNLIKRRKYLLAKFMKFSKFNDDFLKSSFEEEIASLRQNTKFFESKAKEYKDQFIKYQSQLKKQNLDPGAHHGKLVDQAKTLERLKEEMKPLKIRLDSYLNLPPDKTLAKVEIEAIKEKLEEINEVLHQKIDFRHM